MNIRTPADLGALIRDRRKQLGLGQQQLAGRAGVSRQWLIEVERGKPRAEIGLLLRTLEALGIALTTADSRNEAGAGAQPVPIDLNSIVSAARQRR